MAEELKPCPFCGGGAHLEPSENGAVRLEVDHEPWCFLDASDTTRWYYDDADSGQSAVEVAMEEWNRRAGGACEQRRTRLTCRYVRDHMGVAGNWFSRCSECGAEFDERVVDRHFVFCPECGAKVVSK